MKQTPTERAGSAASRNFNLLPFAIMAGGWLAPMAMFRLHVWGPLRPFDYPRGDLMPGPWFVLLSVGAIGLWRVLPHAYFRIRHFERLQRPHDRLGIRTFRKWVPDGDLANRWARRLDPGHRIIRDRRTAEAFVDRTIDSERGHVVLLALGLLTAGHAIAIGWTGWALFLTFGSVVVNVYPILLQRATRVRLEAALSRPSRPRCKF
ncbi:glycosyl-4,4'-diaponeurosporenoate acyltransferase CrtO family protein [Halomonas denitrificans]|nr:hypothetical protein [Halomonas denitrificans]